MAFTDRYIKLPVELYNTKLSELTGDEDSACFSGYLKINPFEIMAYRPCYSKDGSKQLEETLVDFKNGSSAVILLAIDDFEKQINAFAQ